MPELPEVETVVRDLNKKIRDCIIVDFESFWPSAIKNATLKDFKKTVENRKVLGVRRIGKNIFVDLSGNKTIYLHLKMTGHLLVKNRDKKVFSKNTNYFDDRVNQYIRHIWHLRDKSKEIIDMEFSDLRKFAKIVLVDTDKIDQLPEIKSLGVDVMDKSFTVKYFSEVLSRRQKRSIGEVLLEQNHLSGIGNIYRSEILFLAKIHPRRLVSNLSEKEKRTIFSGIKTIMKKAIEMRGTSDSDFRDTNGAPGNFQKFLKVYNREGENCRLCRGKIKREKIGQRSIYFCSQCQK